MKKKIVITGGNGRFANKLKNTLKNPNYFFPSKKELNILNISSIKKYFKKKKAKYLIHCAALSRPMKIHDLEISKSIDTNIIGTANVVKACKELNIKLTKIGVFEDFKEDFLKFQNNISKPKESYLHF